MSLSWFWNIRGVKEELEGYPTSLGAWVAGTAHQLDEAQQTLLGTVENACATKIVKIDLLARNNTLVVKVEYEGGQQDIVRSPTVYDEDGRPHAHVLERFWREINLLRGLKSQASDLPVPAVRCTIEGPRPGTYPCAVIELLPGTMLMNAFGRLPYSAKERTVRTYAEFCVRLFRLEVPQRIGTLRCSEDGTSYVIPWKDDNEHHRAPQVYDTLEAFVDFLIKRKLQSNSTRPNEESRHRGLKILARLDVEISFLLRKLAAPAYRRCVLTHDDLHPTNILISDANGELTGVIDWEHHSVLPAVLAVTYPPFLRCEVSDTVESEDGSTMQTFWVVGPEDAPGLRELFYQVVKSLDREYFDALVDGDVLRQAIQRVGSLQLDNAASCAALEEWMDLAFARYD